MCLKFATYFKTQCNAFMCKLVFCYFVQSLTLRIMFRLKSYRILTTVHYATITTTATTTTTTHSSSSSFMKPEHSS